MSIDWKVIFQSVPSIVSLQDDLADKSLCGLTDTAHPKDEHIIFISSKKHWNKLVGKWNNKNFDKCYLLFCEKFWQQLSEVDKALSLLNSGNISLQSSNFSKSMCDLSKLFFDEEQKRFNDLVDGRQMGTAKIHPTAWIAQNVFIGKEVSIGENVKIYSGCVIMSESSIAADTVLLPNVTLYPKTVVGSRVILHAGVVLGSDGYGFNFIDGVHQKIWHLGYVTVEDDVELGANCSIDRGTFNNTIIKHGSKFDNLVHVAHNCQIGPYALLCGQAGIAGSSTIKDYCVLSGQVAVTNDVVIGEQSQVGGAAVVTGNLPAKSMVAGHPARPLKEWLKGIAFVRKSSLK